MKGGVEDAETVDISAEEREAGVMLLEGKVEKADDDESRRAAANISAEAVTRLSEEVKIWQICVVSDKK